MPCAGKEIFVSRRTFLSHFPRAIETMLRQEQGTMNRKAVSANATSVMLLKEKKSLSFMVVLWTLGWHREMDRQTLPDSGGL